MRSHHVLFFALIINLSIFAWCCASQPTPAKNHAAAVQKIQCNVAREMWFYCKDLVGQPDPIITTKILASEVAKLWKEYDNAQAQSEKKSEVHAQKLVDAWKGADQLGKEIIEQRLQRLMSITKYGDFFRAAFYGPIADEKVRIIKEQQSSSGSSSSSRHP
jgi:hypothetical protein